MSHFLARLVERARGTAPTVEPIIAPRFAPPPEAIVEPEFEPPPIAKSAAREVETPSVREGPTRDATTPPVGKGDQSATGNPPQEVIERVVEGPAQETLLVPLAMPNEQEKTPPSPRTRGSESLRRDSPRRVQSGAPIVRHKRTNHRKPAVPSPSFTISSDQTIASPHEPASNNRPIVRVTIGRIDVRATPAPPALAPRQRAPSEPKLTLDAYLKARKEGAR